MNKPFCVLISDVHYNINTLPLADAAMKAAIAYANDRDLRVIVAGDLHDTKAILRGECVSAMIKTFSSARHRPTVLVGNHDLLNEKSVGNALEFLAPYASLVETPVQWISPPGCSTWLIPYYSDPEALKVYLSALPHGARIIMHQGVSGATPGEYTHDKSALPKEVFANFRVISGHYHRRQDIKCGKITQGSVGLFSYIGNPYTLTFAEAEDGPKGFQVLYDDGSLKFVPLSLRRHVAVDFTYAEMLGSLVALALHVHPHDLVRIRVSGTQSQLGKVDKAAIGRMLNKKDFKLELVAVDKGATSTPTPTDAATDEILDRLTDSLAETPEQKAALKELWRILMYENT